jgi:hypothetical protein
MVTVFNVPPVVDKNIKLDLLTLYVTTRSFQHKHLIFFHSYVASVDYRLVLRIDKESNISAE